MQEIESKKIALHSLINQITVYTNATLEVAYNAGYLTNQTRALDYTPYPVLPRAAGLANLGEVEGLLILNLTSIRRST